MSIRIIGSIAASALAFAALALGCGSDPTATPTPAPTPTPTAVMAAPTPTPEPVDPFEAEWEALIAAAQEEGKLDAFICCALGRVFDGHIDAFQENFGIEIVSATGSSRQQADRVLAERAAVSTASMCGPAASAPPTRGWSPRGRLPTFGTC